MMIVLVTISYPVHIEKAVYEHIFNFRQSPDYLVSEGPCISSKIGDSFRRMCIFEVCDCRLEDAIQYFDEKVKSFVELPGFVYEFKPLSKIEGILRLRGGL
jgi:hypothetical protein